MDGDGSLRLTDKEIAFAEPACAQRFPPVLTVEQAALYQRITDEMLGQIDAASGIRRRGLILAALTRLKQICDHPVLLNGKVAGVNGNPGDIDARSGKCERLIEMLEEVVAEGDSALVFTQFKEMGDILERLLAQRLGVPVLYAYLFSAWTLLIALVAIVMERSD
jgi:SNF2 family DNA or RNA helicase